MKKKALWATGIVALGFLGYTALFNFQNFGKRAKAAEAKLIAKKLHEVLDLHKVRKGIYPPVETIKLDDPELNWYRWGVGAETREFCRDCVITSDSYKIAIYGNIDNDPALDIWLVQSPDGELVQISDDVKN